MLYSKPKPITTTFVESWNVTASLDPQKETLSEVDEWLTKSSHWLGFSIRFDDCLDPIAAKVGLERTLHHIHALGARVEGDSNKLYQLVLRDDRNQGVVMEHFQGSTVTKNIHLPGDSDSRETWRAAGLEAPGPGYSGEASKNDPLLRARLIVFKEHRVSYLCIGINHGVCDGSGICDILQIWSHFTTTKDASSLPEPLARRRVLGERVSTPHKPAKSIEELKSRLDGDLGCPHNPFSFWTFLVKLLPKAIWCMARQDEMELRVSAGKLASLKKDITQQLPKGEWVSTFEVLCASVLLVREASDDALPTSSHNLHVACNLRGRSDRFTKDYFGNAAFDFREAMTLPSEDQWNLNAITTTSQEIHRAMRSGLADAETNACRAKDWYEAARHLGIKNTYDVWSPVVFDALEGKGTFVNSWDKRWLDCNMGNVEASSMTAWFGTLQNLIVNVPRHSKSEDSTIYLALPPAQGRRFRTFCQENKGNIPFEIVK